MIIELVAFNNKCKWRKRLEMTTDIFNRSDADLILFCGDTILNLKDAETLQKLLTNTHTHGIIEIADYNRNKFLHFHHALFYIHDGKVDNLFTSQIFATANQINHTPVIAKRLLMELQDRRRITLGGLSFTIIQCGEINIIANKQKENNKPYFRFENDSELNSMFKDIVKNTDVFLNPIHTPMGNLGKIHARKSMLSECNRYYFSTNNFGLYEGKNTRKESSNIHYAYHNGKPLPQLNYMQDDKEKDSYKISYYEL